MGSGPHSTDSGPPRPVGPGPHQHSRLRDGATVARLAPHSSPHPTKPGPSLKVHASPNVPRAAGTVPFVRRPNARRAALHAEHVDRGLRSAEEPAEAQEGADGHRRRGSPVLGQTARGNPHAAHGDRRLPDRPPPLGTVGPCLCATHSGTYGNAPSDVPTQSKTHKTASFSSWTLLTLTVHLGLTLTPTEPSLSLLGWLWSQHGGANLHACVWWVPL